MVTVHTRETELNLRKYAQIAGGEAELQKGFETWYADNGRPPTAGEFIDHLMKLRRTGPEGIQERFAALKRQMAQAR